MTRGSNMKMTQGNVTTGHGTVMQPVRTVRTKSHKLHTHNYFSSPELFSDSHNSMIGSCGTVCHNRKEMPAILVQDI